MTDNRSPHWRRPHPGQPQPAPDQPRPGQPDRHRELFAVLDGADVSEAVRAAVAHALNSRRWAGPAADHADALVARYLSERDGGSARWHRPPEAGYDPRSRYTLHLTFPAADLGAARAKAIAYADGLATLRPELIANPPLLSRADEWNHVLPLLCGRPGPAGERCGGHSDHLGCHRPVGSSGLDGNRGLCWSDDKPADE